jgi:hypothetical protein
VPIFASADMGEVDVITDFDTGIARIKLDMGAIYAASDASGLVAGSYRGFDIGNSAAGVPRVVIDVFQDANPVHEGQVHYGAGPLTVSDIDFQLIALLS